MTQKSRLQKVTYDRSRVQSGIVHFGVGNFHRSHQAMFIDRLLSEPANRELAQSWGITGVGVLPSDTVMRDALRSQGFEYTLVERRPDGESSARRIGSIVDYLYAPEQLDAVLERLADPATKIVSLTITEGGYNISDSTGRFDTTNPLIVQDAQPGAVPSTVFGVVTAGLQLRKERDVPAFTIMSCDNIEANGSVARHSFTAFANLVDPELGAWIDQEVRFPNSMVDRITPVTTDQDRAWVLSEYGVQDAWPVLSEDFVQWVLEDDFSNGRPPLELAGVQLVEDVRPYELMKLRLLNASHQALAYVGILAGYQYVHDAAADPVIAAMLRTYMDTEATPTLEPVPGVDLSSYKDSLIERFTNPYIRDTLGRLATDASDRIPKFLVPVIRSQRRSGELTPISSAVIAAWTRFAELYVLGEDVPFNDRQEPAIRDGIAELATDPLGLLRNADWFADLVDDLGFTHDYIRSLNALRATSDPRQEVERLTIAHLQTELNE